MDKTEIVKNRIVRLLQSLIISYAVTFILLLVLALLLYKMELDDGMVSIGIAATYLISCFVGGFFAGKKIQEKKFVWGICVGGLYFLLLFALSMLLEPGSMAAASYIGSAMGLCLGGGTLGGMLS